MGFGINTLRMRKNPGIAGAVGEFDDKQDTTGFADHSGSDSDTLSLEARNEKEVQTHPDQVTQSAELGVQKAEAAALVWGKKTVWATYALYVT